VVVEGVSPDGAVTLKNVESDGDGVVEVIFKNTWGRIGERLLFRSDEPDGFGGKRYRNVQTEDWRPLSECVPIPVVDSTIRPALVRAARDAKEHNAATSRTGERLWELTGGVLRCGACGCRMVANRKRNGSEPTKTYNYYRCPTAQRTGACDNRRSHRAESRWRTPCGITCGRSWSTPR
jgi:recombinase-like zinc beta ribbon protein